MTTKRSPFSPPWRPAFPSPRTLSRLSLSTPGGTRMEIFFDLRTRPSPEHVWHCWKVPMGVLTVLMTCPEPPQVLHVVGLVPALTPEPVHGSQRSSLETEISFSHPKTASRKSSRRSYRSSSPLARTRP